MVSDAQLGEGIKNVTEFVTAEGLSNILAGAVPQQEQFKPVSQLWEEEYRLGIQIDQQKGTTVDGMLYSTRQIRPDSSLKIGVVTEGEIPDDWFPRGEVFMPFGGEGRLAAVEVRDSEPFIPALPTDFFEKEKLQVTATLITPGRYGSVAETREIVTKGPFAKADIKCVTACIGKLYQTGGWDLKAGIPRPLVPVIPAGSTWFYELTEEEFNLIKGYHGQPTGPVKAYGYGQIVLGTWKGDS